MISGPYGVTVETEAFESILLIATDLGIIAHLPYISKLLYDTSLCRTRARSIRVIWEVENQDLPRALKEQKFFFFFEINSLFQQA
jgi:hypothetical protein